MALGEAAACVLHRVSSTWPGAGLYRVSSTWLGLGVGLYR